LPASSTRGRIYAAAARFRYGAHVKDFAQFDDMKALDTAARYVNALKKNERHNSETRPTLADTIVTRASPIGSTTTDL
jgi:hypothetical protein